MTSLSAEGAYEGQERSALEALRVRLHRDFDDTVGFAQVERVWGAACGRFDGSRIRAFVPILVERRAVVELRTATSAPKPRPDPVESR